MAREEGWISIKNGDQRDKIWPHVLSSQQRETVSREDLPLRIFQEATEGIGQGVSGVRLT